MIQVAGFDGCPNCRRKDEPPFTPSFPGERPLLLLMGAVSMKGGDGHHRQFNGTSAPLRLRLHKARFAINALQLVAHAQKTRFDVNILPSKTQDFALSQS